MVGISNQTRKIIRDYVHCRIGNIWVPDIVGSMVPDSSTTLAVAISLKGMFAKDGVHLTREHYGKLATLIQGLVESKIAASVSVSGGVADTRQQKTFFWKGFVSPVGSARPTNAGSFHKSKVIGLKRPSGGHHPYRKN